MPPSTNSRGPHIGPGETLLDGRSKTVLELVSRSVSTLPGSVLELGVCWGGSTRLIAELLPQHPVVAVDSFEGLVDYGPNDPAERGVGHVADEHRVRDALSAHPNVRLVKGHFPDPTCLAEIGDGPLALAHFDADLFEPAMAFFDHVWPRMVPGGVLLVDDYGEGHWSGVRIAFREFFGRDPSLWSGRQAVHVKSSA